MTPKEKAKELVLKYWNLDITMSYINDGVIIVESINKHLHEKDAKQCALIAVDEMIEALELYGQQNYELQNMDRTLSYYDNVKQEIQSL